MTCKHSEVFACSFCTLAHICLVRQHSSKHTMDFGLRTVLLWRMACDLSNCGESLFGCKNQKKEVTVLCCKFKLYTFSSG